MPSDPKDIWDNGGVLEHKVGGRERRSDGVLDQLWCVTYRAADGGLVLTCVFEDDMRPLTLAEVALERNMEDILS